MRASNSSQNKIDWFKTLTLALTQTQIHTFTRPAATLSHPMGEGQKRASTFPASLEITAAGLAGRSRSGMGETPHVAGGHPGLRSERES
jgi:hypothetical protein